MYDDPPEPTESEMNEFETEQAIKQAPTVRIEGLSAESVAVIVREAVRANYRLDEKAGEMLKEAVDEQVEALLKEEARAQITALVAATLEAGFTEHDRYGQKTGKQMTAQALIIEQLTAKSSDGYQKPELTMAHRVAASVISDRFSKLFNDELERAKIAFRVQVDELLKAKLVESLKSALGLR
jgi:hypothetical protein